MTNARLGPNGWELGAPDYATDGSGPAARIRVDPGQTGFFAGRMFRSYVETVVAQGGATPFYARFTSPVDFILWNQKLTLTQGAVRMLVLTGVSFAGSWTTQPLFGVNRMSERPMYDGAFYVPKATFETGGTFTGGSETDRMLVRAASSNVNATNAGESQSERGLPAGTYGLKFSILDGGLNVNDAAQMLYELEWEERA
ncbi:hypothetical protein [Comamonas sp. F1-6]|uniref:hypothetical protein n=1 Tax=Comamonas sp. F1-6 TaxID=673550 RepID=UPI0031DC82DF